MPLKDIPYRELAAWEQNPRLDFTSEAARAELEALADSLVAQGTLSSLVVRPGPNGGPAYQVVAGGRRLHAFGLAIARGARSESDTLPCQVRELDDAAALQVALTENLDRRDLHPLDEADTLYRLVHDFDQAPKELGPRLGVTRRHVEARLQLRRGLAKPAKAAFRRGEIGVRQARLLASLCDKGRQGAVVKEIKAGTWQYRDLEDLRRSLRSEQIWLEVAFFDPFDYPWAKLGLAPEATDAEDLETLEARFLARDKTLLPLLYAADRELFVDLQRAAIETKARNLEPHHAFVDVIYPDAEVYSYQYFTGGEDDATGVVIDVSSAWIVQVYRNRLRPGQRPGAAARAAPDAPEAGPQAPESLSLLPTAKGAALCAEVKTAALRAAIRERGETLGMIITLLGLLHRPWQCLALHTERPLATCPAFAPLLAEAGLAETVDADDVVGSFRRLCALDPGLRAELFVHAVALQVAAPPVAPHDPADPDLLVALAEEVEPIVDLSADEAERARFAELVAGARRPLLAAIAAGAGVADGELHEGRRRGRDWLRKGKVGDIRAALLEALDAEPAVAATPLPLYRFHGPEAAQSAFDFAWPSFAGELDVDAAEDEGAGGGEVGRGVLEDEGTLS